MPGKRVVCDRCGWRTVRVYMSCECDGEYGCHCGPRVGYGTCAKCGDGMRTPADIRAEAEFFANVGSAPGSASVGSNVTTTRDTPG